MNLDNIWSEFYTDFNKERGNRKFTIDAKNNYYIVFLRKFEKDWSDCLKEIYRDKGKIKIENDLILIAIKNLTETILQNDKNVNADFNDYNIFKNLLVKVKLSELLK